MRARHTIAVVATLAVVGCTAVPGGSPSSRPTHGGLLDREYDVSQIRQTGVQSVPLGGAIYRVTTYVNDAYLCGPPAMRHTRSRSSNARHSEPQSEAPLWVMLHGGGTGWFQQDGTYLGDEGHNHAETPAALLATLGLYLIGDTFVGERVRAGDRVVLGSLCDHDLYLGLGQPYPNNPAGGTVDGLLANLAMVDYVEHDRPTSSVIAIGQSAGSYGAWALAHARHDRGLPIVGAVLDSGLLSERSFDLFEAGVGRELYEFDADEMAAKHGPYFTDPALYAEHAVADGFDVPLFVADTTGDPGCGGSSDPIAATEGMPNCDWLYQPLAHAVRGPAQQVHIYPGSTHVVTASPGQVQDDLRAWFGLLG